MIWIIIYPLMTAIIFSYIQRKGFTDIIRIYIWIKGQLFGIRVKKEETPEESVKKLFEATYKHEEKMAKIEGVFVERNNRNDSLR